MGEPFRITYRGGGSRFVVTLLHGLAEVAPQLRALGRPIELRLLDRAPANAEPMAAYATIVARQTELPIRAMVTDDEDAALLSADWVIESIGQWDQVKRLHADLRPVLGVEVQNESLAALAMEAAIYWPHLRRMCRRLSDLSPNATVTVLANPTDVMSRAVQAHLGLQSNGICVEVPQLQSWLSLHLQVPRPSIDLRYIGLNHCGWVSRWTVGREDGTPLLRQRLPQAMAGPEWDPNGDEFAWVFQKMGHLRTSPFHMWPIVTHWDAARRKRRAAFIRNRPYAPLNWDQYCESQLSEALRTGRLIEPEDRATVLAWAMPFKYSSSRFNLGGTALGLAGGVSSAVPLQTRNGKSNPSLPADAWVEAPTVARHGGFFPHAVQELPPLLIEPLVALARQRMLLADWLADGGTETYLQAYLAWPDAVPLERHLELAPRLTEVMNHA